MNSISHKKQYSPWRARLEVKMNATRREAASYQKDVMKKGLPRKYNKMSIPEALETTKQRLTALPFEKVHWTSRIQKDKQDVLHQTIQSVL